MFSGCNTMLGNVSNRSGMGYYERGNYHAAADEFQRALSSDPGNPDYMANYARVQLKMGNDHAAESLFRQALTAAPSHQPSYRGLAELMQAQGRGDEAQAMLSTWADSQPYNSEPQIEIARLHRQSGRIQQAQGSLEKALQVNPGDPVALAEMGSLYEATGRSDLATGMYQQSLRSDWNQTEVHSRLAAATRAASLPPGVTPAGYNPSAQATTAMNGPAFPQTPAMQQNPAMQNWPTPNATMPPGMNFPVQTAGAFQQIPGAGSPFPGSPGFTTPPPGPWRIVSETTPEIQSAPPARQIQFSEPTVTQPGPAEFAPVSSGQAAPPSPDPAFSAAPVSSAQTGDIQPATLTTLGSSETSTDAAEAALPVVPSF